jgi:hypothetical protein
MIKYNNNYINHRFLGVLYENSDQNNNDNAFRLNILSNLCEIGQLKISALDTITQYIL